MATLLCFRCRQPLTSGSPYCPTCGTSYSSGEEDPEAIRTERQFLLEKALEISDIEDPSFSGFTEADLTWRAERRPTLPLGRPVDYEMEGLDRDELIERLDASDAWERGMAGLLLSEHDEPETVFALLRHLGDGDSDVRTCLLWALGQTANPLTLAPLLEFARIEKDKIVLSQLAATLFQIVSLAGHGRNREKTERGRPEELEAVEAELLLDPDAELFVARGRIFVKAGQLLKAIGSFSQAHTEHGATSPKALLYRSQSFLLMGKPLYALDDLLACPDEFDYPPMFYLHRAALVTLGRQIVSAAKEKGLTDYARLFERRLDKISEKKDRQSED
jgi:hypothetical protein